MAPDRAFVLVPNIGSGSQQDYWTVSRYPIRRRNPFVLLMRNDHESLIIFGCLYVERAILGKYIPRG
jgi:hypothetical protein